MPLCPNVQFTSTFGRTTNVDTGEELGFGQEGEVCVTGPSLMLGYYKHPEATEELFFEADGIRWMRTGDLGMVTEKGFFHITGRIKRIFWKMGDDDIVYRVYPMKIEEVICQCEAVAHCAVVGRKNTAKGYDPIAFVVKKNDEQAEHEKDKYADDLRAAADRHAAAELAACNRKKGGDQTDRQQNLAIQKVNDHGRRVGRRVRHLSAA